MFKSNSTLLALFDACKGFEEDKASLMSTRMSFIDESTAAEQEGGATEVEEESKFDESIVMIRPLDPALVNVRYLPPKAEDVPQYTLVLDLDETLIHYRDNSPDT